MNLGEHRSERVLVVDRDSEFRSDLAEHLGEIGHIAVAVAEGVEALRVIPLFAPTAIIAEWRATGGGGRSLIECLRDRLDSARLPILVLGDAGHAEEFQRMLPLGRVWYIARGAEWAHLERTFETMLARSEVGSPGL